MSGFLGVVLLRRGRRASGGGAAVPFQPLKVAATNLHAPPPRPSNHYFCLFDAAFNWLIRFGFRATFSHRRVSLLKPFLEIS